MKGSSRWAPTGPYRPSCDIPKWLVFDRQVPAQPGNRPEISQLQVVALRTTDLCGKRNNNPQMVILMLS